MIGAEFIDGIQRREIDLAGDSLACLKSQRRLSICTAERRDRLFLTARDLKAQPGLPSCVVKFNIAPGQIRDGNCRHDRFVSDVLQSFEFEIHLNLRFCCDGKSKNRQPWKNASKIVCVTPAVSDPANVMSSSRRNSTEPARLPNSSFEKQKPETQTRDARVPLFFCSNRVHWPFSVMALN
ncbi:MAG: hypothetical protein ACXWBM_07165 [Chthoniobacterales bacterium]